MEKNEEDEKSHHEKKVSEISEAYKEALEVIKEAKELEEKVVVFVNESKSFFERMFVCCNGKK